jgi:putative serine protease PepD
MSEPFDPADPSVPGSSADPAMPSFAADPGVPGSAADPGVPGSAADPLLDPWAAPGDVRGVRDNRQTWPDPFGDPRTVGHHQPDGPRPSGRGRMLAGALAIALVAGAVGGAVGALVETHQSQPALTVSGADLGAPPTGTLSRPAGSVAGIAERVLPTVVSIQVTTSTGGDTGSGFVLRSDGYILTNNHVVDTAANAGQIEVQLNNGDTLPASIVGRSPVYDLAVLKVRATGLPVAVLGNSDDVVVGDASIAVGSPLGLAGTVTSGIISATNRPVATGPSESGSSQSDSYISALQTDAAINPGNSGGPLVNSSGQVIGVNSAIASLSPNGDQSGSIGVGFAIPVNEARSVAQQLIRYGYATYPVIGVGLDSTYAGAGGRIADVQSGGPAATAGLRTGDVILSVDGRPVSDSEDAIVAIRAHRPGDRVTVRFRRGGGALTVVVVLGSARG